jgi:ABC-type sugar transport system, permease component
VAGSSDVASISLVVFKQEHYYLQHFWLQLWNSLLIAVTTGVLTLLIATAAAFAISRLKVKGGRVVMNFALFTYFIPAAFLAVPCIARWDCTACSTANGR